MMASSQTLIEQFSGLVSARAQQREPEWLQTLRSDAWQRFAARGVPTKRLENWHYSAADFWLQQFGERHGLAPLTPARQLCSAGTLPHGHLLQFNHGYLVDQRIDSVDREQVSLQPLSQLADAERAELAGWLAEQRPVDAFADLATALAPECWVLSVAPQQKLSQPIVVSHLAATAGLQVSQLIIWLRDGAEAT